MKKAAAYIFLFVYVVIFFKPVTPIIANAISHAFFYSQHMATVHFENGKMHLHKEMIQKAGEENSTKDIGLLKKSQPTEEYISPCSDLNTYPIATNKNNVIMLVSIIYKRSPAITTPPPRFI